MALRRGPARLAPERQVPAKRRVTPAEPPPAAAAAPRGSRTIQHFETGKRQPIPPTLDAIQRALEAAGIEFANGDGVWLRQGPAASP